MPSFESEHAGNRPAFDLIFVHMITFGALGCYLLQVDERFMVRVPARMRDFFLTHGRIGYNADSLDVRPSLHNGVIEARSDN